jgi:hypothetical protein
MTPRAPITHRLRVWPKFTDALSDGTKTFEARKNDRDYRTGDTLELIGWDPDTCTTTGWSQRRTITYMLRGPAFGVEAGWAILGLSPLQAAPPMQAPYQVSSQHHVRAASDADILLELWKRKHLVDGLRDALGIGSRTGPTEPAPGPGPGAGSSGWEGDWKASDIQGGS